MKIAYTWLKDYVELPENPRELGSELTLAGLAVDTMETTPAGTIFDLDITTNRPDCLNHVGVAREVHALYGAPLRYPEFTVTEGTRPVKDAFSISIEAPDLCGRYCGRYIAGVKIGPSPEWLRDRLESVGVRSINNVVDVTNYVLMELGQPLHAFDADTLRGRKIVVRRAAPDEPMTTLDGIERKLNPSILVIADAERPVALAGIMGGADTEISSVSTNVFLESAWFDPQTIRKAARALGLNTEASYRFERGADIGIALHAVDRAARLIQQVAGGEVYSGVLDVYPAPALRLPIFFRRERVAALLGAEVENASIVQILERLGFALNFESDPWRVMPPTFRLDVQTEEDLIEEIARHYGYDQFPSTLPPTVGAGAALPREAEERRLRGVLAACGYTEILTYSFSSEEAEERFVPEGSGRKPVKLTNPMSEDASTLRQSLVGGMLRTLQWNLNRGLRDLQFYEWSKVYDASGERLSLVIGAVGEREPSGVHGKGGDFSFYDLKGDIEVLLQVAGRAAALSTANLPAYYHPGRSAVLGGVAILGELHPDYAASLKIRPRVYLAEVDIERLLDAKSARQVEAIPRYPSVRRDFSLVLRKETTYEDVRQAIAAVGIPELVSVEPFDRIENGAFPETHYGLSISVVYRSPERTLIDAEVEAFDRRILEILKERLDAQLRRNLRS